MKAESVLKGLVKAHNVAIFNAMYYNCIKRHFVWEERK